MNNFDLGSKKYIIILAIICIVFVLLIAKAFDMASNSENEDFNSAKEPVVNTVVNNNVPANVNTQEEEIQEENSQFESEYTDESEFDNEEIQDDESEEEATKPEAEELSLEEKAAARLYIATKFRTTNQLDRAMYDYQEVAKKSQNSEITAMCYDGIANIYAISKDYEKALSYANQANNLMPATSREMFIARLEFKLGKEEDAKNRIANILSRDFLYNDN